MAPHQDNPARTQQFASDNNAGIAPAALQALLASDASGHEPSYGEDRWTVEVCDRMRRLFEDLKAAQGPGRRA